MIDLKKTYTTRDGKPVRGLKPVSGRLAHLSAFPLIGEAQYPDGMWYEDSWTESGHAFLLGERDKDDLVEAPTPAGAGTEIEERQTK